MPRTGWGNYMSAVTTATPVLSDPLLDRAAVRQLTGLTDDAIRYADRTGRLARFNLNRHRRYRLSAVERFIQAAETETER